MPGKNGQIAGSALVRAAGNAGSIAQPTHGYRGITPPATVHAVPEFIWGMSDVSGSHPSRPARGPRRPLLSTFAGASYLRHDPRTHRIAECLDPLQGDATSFAYSHLLTDI
jgi:hypothetical protein